MKNKISLSLLLTATYALSAAPAGTSNAELIVGTMNGQIDRVSDAIDAGALVNLQYGDAQDSAIAHAISSFIETKLWLSKRLKIEAAATAVGIATTLYFALGLLNNDESSHDSFKSSPVSTTSSADSYQYRRSKKSSPIVSRIKTAIPGVITLILGGKTVHSLASGNKKKLDNRFKIIELLIAKKADVTLKNNQGQSALRVIENCLIEHANDRYLVAAMKEILELLDQREAKKSEKVQDVELDLFA